MPERRRRAQGRAATAKAKGGAAPRPASLALADTAYPAHAEPHLAPAAALMAISALEPTATGTPPFPSAINTDAPQWAANGQAGSDDPHGATINGAATNGAPGAPPALPLFDAVSTDPVLRAPEAGEPATAMPAAAPPALHLPRLQPALLEPAMLEPTMLEPGEREPATMRPATARIGQDANLARSDVLPAQRVMHPIAFGQADPRQRFGRVAIVHYWLVTMRGGERVLERMLRLFPQADIFTHVYDPSAMSETIRSHKVTTSFIQHLPGARRHYQSYLPLMPMALEQLDLRGYDLVISSESGPAKGVITAPDALHLSYVHSPMRYLWDHYHDYRDAAGLLSRAVMPLLCHRLRAWDVSSAARIDRIVANSHFIQRRIAKAWRREASVVHPPVDVDLFHPAASVGPAYLWVGQMVPYKRPDLAIDAFNRLGLPLVMVGDGPLAAAMRRRAGPNITIVPRLDFNALRRAYGQCRALVFPAQEDFGMVPVEVIASGRPVLAYAGGGALDSVTQDVSGQFFASQTVESLIAGVEAMEAWLPHFDAAAAIADARRFAPGHFDRGLLAALE